MGNDEIVVSRVSRTLTSMATLNPLRISGTSMPPNLLMAVKLIVLCMVLRRGEVVELAGLPFIPFLPALGSVSAPHVYGYTLLAVFGAAALALWFNRAVHVSCLVMGSVLMLATLSSEFYYHNNRVYVAVFFLIAAMRPERLRLLILRAQLAVMYLGSAVNKLLEPDWRTGEFVRDWLPHYLTGYAKVFTVVPELPTLLGWVGMLTELCLATMFLVPRLVPLAALVGITFHTGLVLLTMGNTFGVFWYALIGTYLSLLKWPGKVVVTFNPTKKLHHVAHLVLRSLDFEKRLQWVSRQEISRLEGVVDDEAGLTGSAALARILLCCPGFYLAALFFFTLFPHGNSFVPFVTYAVLAVIAYGLARAWVRTVIPRGAA